MNAPKFKIWDFVVVKDGAPKRSCPGQRVRIWGIIEAENRPPDKLKNIPPGRVYRCEFWGPDGEPLSCEAAEQDLELSDDQSDDD